MWIVRMVGKFKERCTSYKTKGYGAWSGPCCRMPPSQWLLVFICNIFVCLFHVGFLLLYRLIYASYKCNSKIIASELQDFLSPFLILGLTLWQWGLKIPQCSCRRLSNHDVLVRLENSLLSNPLYQPTFDKEIPFTLLTIMPDFIFVKPLITRSP